jgi:CRP/FNR family transcriptional regulator, cyclic AMP receptor protein
MEYYFQKRPTSPLPSVKPSGLTPSEPVLMLPPSGVLAGLGQESLAQLCGYGRRHCYTQGTVVMREGEMQDRFYIVISGQLSISARSAGHDIPLNIAEAGECLGEISLLEPGPATATVQVLKDAVLWSMDIAQLRAYLFEHTGGAGVLLMGMASCLSKRLREANQLIARHHVAPVETLPQGRERAITAENTRIHLGLFERFKKTMAPEKKIKISTEIKM